MDSIKKIPNYAIPCVPVLLGILCLEKKSFAVIVNSVDDFESRNKEEIDLGKLEKLLADIFYILLILKSSRFA